MTTAGRSVVFRTDASVEIGTGHVMRCLTLADRLRSHGLSCRFICRDHAGSLTRVIQSRGYTVELLPDDQTSGTDGPAHESWLGADWRTDAQQTLGHVSRDRPEWLVVDHYGADARWEEVVRPACKQLLVIDDLADRPHACDLLLDQNLGRDRESYARLVPPGCSVLTGPAYALLRPEFAQWRRQSLERRRSAGMERILVTMGGMDKDNATAATLRGLAACALPPGCRVQVVLGPHAPWFNQVRALAAGLPYNVAVLPGTDEMARLMAESDLAVGAAGSTSWERCALGVPSILFVLAENQRSAAAALSAAGAARVVDPRDSSELCVASAVRQLLANPTYLADLSHQASLVCDGFGTARVIAKMRLT